MSEPCQYETVNDIIADRDRLRAECDALRAKLARLTTPRPMTEYSKNEAPDVLLWVKIRDYWAMPGPDEDGTHWTPLPDVKEAK